MSAYVLLAIFVGIYLILQTYWKSKSATVFLLLCAGSILSASTSGTVSTSIANLFQNQDLPLTQIVKAVFLLGPSILGIILTKGQAKKKHALLYFLINICCVILAYLWFIRTLSFEQFSKLESMDITAQLLSVRDAVIGASVVLVLMFVLFDRKKKDKHEKKKKH